jgi:chromate transporter
MDWLLIGIQSFGGGSSTFILIHQAAIKRGWMTEDEFIRVWALAQIAPGINLLKLTSMIGFRLRGWPGLLSAMGGLLLPSAAVTVLMTAGFATIRTLPWIQAMMKGILPATIGLSLAMGVQMALPILSRAQKEGAGRLSAHIFILLAAALLLGIAKLSPVFILLLSGVAAIVSFVLIPIREQAHSSEKA